MASSSGTHSWRFTKIGGFHQPRMETAADFANLEHLDQKLWAALACPVKDMAFDVKTLAMLDTDNDGRIRAPEVVAASVWCRTVLKSLDELAKGGQPLKLANIDTNNEEGAAILASAERVATDLGAGEQLTVEQAAEAAEKLAKSAHNGDGVIPASATEDEALKALIGEVVEVLGGADDRSGDKGVDAEQLEKFYTDAEAVVAWLDAGTGDAMPLGEGSAAAAAAVEAVKAKVDDYFARCRLAHYDERALTALNRKEEEYLAIAAEDLSVTAEEVSGFPLARVAAGQPLPLVGPVNPAWAAKLGALRDAAAKPVTGHEAEQITEQEWADIQAKIAPFQAWQGAKPDTPVAGMDGERLRAILASEHKAALTALIEADKAAAPQVDSLTRLEKLVRLHRDLFQLAQNFVNLTHFYSDSERAVFEAGTLYLDGRSCELVVDVANPAKHAALAARSKLYLAYCDCTRPSGEKRAIVAAFTDGDAEYLLVGRNGVFYDRDGKDWDATITKVVSNPISLREAFWAPYRAIAQALEERAARVATEKAKAAEKGAMAQGGTLAGDVAADATPPKIDIGTVAAIAVGLGALGSVAVAAIGYVTGLFTLPFWIIVLVVLGIFLAISAPSVVMAYFKLRHRSLGAILDSNGWAINGQAGVSVRFGRTMTHVAKLPPGSRVDSKDKYADPVNPWPRIIGFFVVVGFFVSLLNWFGFFAWATGGLVGSAAGSFEDLVEQAASDDTDAAEAPAPAE